MKEIFGGLAAVALMVVCCALPLVLVGAGSAGIAGILAWLGGLNPILVLAAVGGGGVLAYHVVRRARGSANQREGIPGDAPSALLRKEGGQGPWRIPVTRRHFPE